MKRLILAAFAAAGLVCAQNAALMPLPKVQFLDGNGVPLAGGLLYTCVAGASCAPSFAGDPPLNPLATYTDATAGTANPNPIVLDSAGRAAVWLGSGSYKLVLQDATGAAVWTQDGVSSTSLKAVTTTTGAVSNFSVPGTLTVGNITVTGKLTGAVAYAPPSGVARTLGAKANDVVSVKDYAVCDGSTDDTVAIQNAMNYAVSQGATLMWPAVTCKITSALVPPNGIHIQGSGPLFGSVLLAPNSQIFTIDGSTRTGGFAFRIYIDDMMLESTATTLAVPLVRVNSAYSVQFNRVWVYQVPNTSTAFDYTACNDMQLNHVVIYGLNNGTAAGVLMHGVTSLKVLEPDFENLHYGIANYDSGVVDIFSPYMERNIIAVDHETGASGQTNVYGGWIQGVNSSTLPIRALSRNIHVDGTKLTTGTGTVPFFSSDPYDMYYEPVSKHLGFGTVTPASRIDIVGNTNQFDGVKINSFYQYTGTASDFTADYVFQNGTGSDKTMRLFGPGSVNFHLYTDGTVTAAGGFVAGASSGLYVTKNLKGSDGNNCTETFTGGLLTASTCP